MRVWNFSPRRTYSLGILTASRQRCMPVAHTLADIVEGRCNLRRHELVGVGDRLTGATAYVLAAVRAPVFGADGAVEFGSDPVPLASLVRIDAAPPLPPGCAVALVAIAHDSEELVILFRAHGRRLVSIPEKHGARL